MRRSIILLAVAAMLLIPFTVEARITKIVITRTESPTFSGTSFGTVGQYEKIVGRAYGEVDPHDPLNAIIEDIRLAPRNARGHVEYDTDFYILKPIQMNQGNGLLFYNVANRGNLGGLSAINIGVTGGNDPTGAGDGFAMKRGYTFLWGGWQADVLPGGNRMTFNAPVATNGGAVITGRVRTEYIVSTPPANKTQNLGQGWFTGTSHDSYETVSTDNTKPMATLTKRVKEKDPRVLVPNSDWAFTDCSTGWPGVPDTKKICLKDGFDPNYIYELLYTAKNP
jgi:hypothetical protein